MLHITYYQCNFQHAYVFQTLNVFGVCVLHISFNLFYCDNIDNIVNQDILNDCNILVISSTPSACLNLSHIRSVLLHLRCVSNWIV